MLSIERKNSASLGDKWDKGVPIEVIPLAYNPVMLKIKSQFGGKPKLRLAKSKAVSIVAVIAVKKYLMDKSY